MQQTLRLYRAYCILNLIWYFTIFGLGCVGLWVPEDQIPDGQSGMLRGASVVLIGMGTIFGSAILKLMRLSRNETSYMAHFVNICLGITTCILAPYCIYLAVQWQRPDFKEEYLRPEFKL